MDAAQVRDYLALLSNNPHVQALLVVVLALVAAKLVDLIVSRAFRQLTAKTKTEVDDQILDALHRPIFTTVALLGLGIALVIEVPDDYEKYAKAAVGTLVALVWLAFFLRLSSILLQWMVREERRFQLVQPATAPLFGITAKLVILGFGIYFILQAWDIEVTAWLASAGIFGLAIGLAAQDTLGNLFAGISILADVPYRDGDYIVLDGGERGKVTRIGLRSTRILTRDQVEVTIPNAIIARSRIVNESGGPSPQRRLRLPVGVAYGSDIDQVTQVLLKVATDEGMVSSHPEPQVHFASFGDSSLDLQVRCWINEPENRGRVTHNLNQAIYKALNAAGIEIPYPKRDVYVKELPSSPKGAAGKEA